MWAGIILMVIGILAAVVVALPAFREWIMFDIVTTETRSGWVERVVGEVPPRFVDTPEWGLIRNFQIIDLLEQRMESRNTYQGRLYVPA